MWPEGFKAAVILTFDVDAESGVLWEFPDTTRRLGILRHQAYGPLVGLPRLLRILQRHGAAATFFVPGFTAERHPDAVRAIVAAGHEVAAHGYLHEIVTELDQGREEAVLERSVEILERVAGARPRGWRAPMWEVNHGTPALLARHGFIYDSSLMDADLPYRLAVGPERDSPTLIEIPPHWSLEDGVQYAWLPGIWDTATIESPAKLLTMWELDLEAAVAEGTCLVLTMHPCLSGRPSRALVFERLLERIVGTPGVWVPTANEIAEHVAKLSLESVYHAPLDVDSSSLRPPRGDGSQTGKSGFHGDGDTTTAAVTDEGEAR
jgi:peptidoglycan/xylan/chitin deacetylase (PgdA/CDA1 family)